MKAVVRSTLIAFSERMVTRAGWFIIFVNAKAVRKETDVAKTTAQVRVNIEKILDFSHRHEKGGRYGKSYSAEVGTVTNGMAGRSHKI